MTTEIPFKVGAAEEMSQAQFYSLWRFCFPLDQLDQLQFCVICYSCKKCNYVVIFNKQKQCWGIVFSFEFLSFLSWLQEVIEAIAESAFKTSPYPVILSFENHVDS